jgi:hypothetical protein
MHWLIMHADQVISGADQITANIKIQKTGAKVASYAEAMSRFCFAFDVAMPLMQSLLVLALGFLVRMAPGGESSQASLTKS